MEGAVEADAFDLIPIFFAGKVSAVVVTQDIGEPGLDPGGVHGGDTLGGFGEIAAKFSGYGLGWLGLGLRFATPAQGAESESDSESVD